MISKSQIAPLWQRGQLGWPRRYPLVQAPNPPLLIALFGWLLAATDIAGSAGLGQVLSTAGLLVWAGEEVIAGANLFRRLLGSAVLLSLFLDLVGVR